MPPVGGQLTREADRERFGRIVVEMREATAGFGRIGGVVAGISGVSPGGETGSIAAGIFAEAFGLEAGRVLIEDDVAIAFRAAFSPGEGHLIYAGTGSIGLHIRADGSSVRVGGRGMLIDDAGSGFSIGREGLAQSFRALDRDPLHRSAIADALFAAIGGRDWDAARAYVYGGENPRDAVAQLARAVAAAADAGDAAALGILQRAGDELGRLAELLAAREGALPAALAGRAAALHPAIFAAARARAQPLEMTLLAIDAASAAARMAFEGTGACRKCSS